MFGFRSKYGMTEKCKKEISHSLIREKDPIEESGFPPKLGSIHHLLAVHNAKEVDEVPEYQVVGIKNYQNSVGCTYSCNLFAYTFKITCYFTFQNENVKFSSCKEF